MTHAEGTSEQDSVEWEKRAPVARAVEAEAEKGMRIEALTEGYVTLQKQIIEMQTNLHRSIDDAVAERAAGNLPRAELLTNIGRAITLEIDGLHTKKKEMEEEIQKAGGNPSDYTVH